MCQQLPCRFRTLEEALAADPDWITRQVINLDVGLLSGEGTA